MENKEVLRLIYDLDTGNLSTYKIEQNKIKVIKDYIEQLEKENAKLISSDKYMNDNFILMKRIQEQERCIKRLQGNKQNRESYIVNLEKRLQAKDKALDKACSWLEGMDCKIIDVSAWDKKIETKECWKEWCENGRIAKALSDICNNNFNEEDNETIENIIGECIGLLELEIQELKSELERMKRNEK